MHEKFNSNYEDIIVCIGPAIKKCCFTSEDDKFKKIFTDVWNYEDKYIYYDSDNKKRFHIDLSFVITEDFINLGIKRENIVVSDICTKCNSNNFFSYRDSTFKKQSDYGTMATIVTLT